MDVQSWSQFCWDSKSPRSWAEAPPGGAAWIQAQVLFVGALLPALGLGKAGFFARFSECCCPFPFPGAPDSAASLSILVPCSPSHRVYPAPACGLVRNYSLGWWGRVGASARILPLWELTAQWVRCEMLAQHFCIWLGHTWTSRKVSIPLEMLVASLRWVTFDLQLLVFLWIFTFLSAGNALKVQTGSGSLEIPYCMLSTMGVVQLWRWSCILKLCFKLTWELCHCMMYQLWFGFCFWHWWGTVLSGLSYRQTSLYFI